MVLLQNTSILNAALASATVCDVLLQILFALGAIMLVMCFAGLSVVAERKICAYIQGRYGPNRTACCSSYNGACTRACSCGSTAVWRLVG